VGGAAQDEAMLERRHQDKAGRAQKSALVILGAGHDAARLSSLNQVGKAGRRSGVLIYAVGIGNPNGGLGMGGARIMIGPFIIGGGGGGVDEQNDTPTLEEASDATRGESFVPPTPPPAGDASAPVEPAPAPP